MNTFAWQGWRIDLPPDWNPVKLEGDYARGHALITDLSRPRLGIRWTTTRGRFDVEEWATRTLAEEVGEAAASRRRESNGYFAADGDRQAWVAQSSASHRLIQIVNHNGTLTELLPTFRDATTGESRLWSVFDLRCTIPAEYPLASQRLNAGDLCLTFASGRRMLTVRQLALAKMALQRMSLEKWLEWQERSNRYQSLDGVKQLDDGVLRTSPLRRRFAWMPWLPREMVTLVRHDQARDRLVFVQANDEPLARAVAQTVGRA